MLSSGPVWAEQVPDTAAELAALKAEFVNSISQKDDPEEMMALAAYYAGRSWEIAARQMAGRYQKQPAREYMERIGRQELELALKKAERDPVQRQILGLKLFYRSVNAVAGILAFQRGDKVTLEQLQTLETQLNQSIEAGEDTMNVMISLTKGVMTMLTLVLRSVDVSQKYLNQVNRELELRVLEADAIKAREDIHYYAKLFLWAVNNINGCFRMIYFLSLAVDEKLAADVDPVREAVEKHSKKNDSPIRAMTLGLTAVAEAGFPVIAALIRQ
ncbi:MAG: hypothetical protein JRI34_03455 [Deltaproteobacteria bacterium]|nr:hypothetical protein [Deltaproteobacteria bacterium]